MSGRRTARPECQQRVWVQGDKEPEVVKGVESTVRYGGEGEGGVKGSSGVSPAVLLTQRLP